MITSGEERNKKAIKSAVIKGDFVGLIKAGVDSFFYKLCSSKPRTFRQFILDTSAFHEKFILDTCKQEHLNYRGGKMFIELTRNEIESLPILLSSDFYFQNQNQEWIKKTKKGQIDSSSFTDWDTNEMVADLRTCGKLEFLIELPG